MTPINGCLLKARHEGKKTINEGEEDKIGHTANRRTDYNRKRVGVNIKVKGLGEEKVGMVNGEGEEREIKPTK